MINKLGSPLLSFLSDKVFWSRVYRVVFEEDVAPLVLDVDQGGHHHHDQEDDDREHDNLGERGEQMTATLPKLKRK